MTRLAARLAISPIPLIPQDSQHFHPPLVFFLLFSVHLYFITIIAIINHH